MPITREKLKDLNKCVHLAMLGASVALTAFEVGGRQGAEDPLRVLLDSLKKSTQLLDELLAEPP